MPSTYTTNTGIEKPGAGEQSGSWGRTVNINYDMIDIALNGVKTLSLVGTESDLTTVNGQVSDGHYPILVLTGTLAAAHTISIVPTDAQKVYFVNNSAGETVTFAQSGGINTASITDGASGIIYADGTGNVYNLTDTLQLASPYITGGELNGVTIDESPIGSTTADTGAFTTLSASDDTSLTGLTVSAAASFGDTLSVAGQITYQGTAITATPAQINFLDGFSASLTTDEVNTLLGANTETTIQAQLDLKANAADSVLSGTTSFNQGSGANLEISNNINTKTLAATSSISALSASFVDTMAAGAVSSPTGSFTTSITTPTGNITDVVAETGTFSEALGTPDLTATTASITTLGATTANITTANITTLNADGVDVEVGTISGQYVEGTTSITTPTANVTTLDLGDWTISQVGSELKFSYGGNAKFKITSAGALVAEDDVTAFGNA